MDQGLPRRPWRLLRTRWPWTCTRYLAAQVAAGWVAWFAMGTFVLATLWAKYWARRRCLGILAVPSMTLLAPGRSTTPARPT